MRKFLMAFDMSGGVWLGLWTASMIVMALYVTFTKGHLDGGIVGSYGAALGAFAAHSISKVVKGADDGGDTGNEGQ